MNDFIDNGYIVIKNFITTEICKKFCGVADFPKNLCFYCCRIIADLANYFSATPHIFGENPAE